MKKEWYGTVWCNPPYGKESVEIIKKMYWHNNGLLLIFNRSETKIFHSHIYPYSLSMLLYNRSIHFTNCNGEKVGTGSGAPSVLFAFGNNADAILKRREDIGHGRYFKLN